MLKRLMIVIAFLLPLVPLLVLPLLSPSRAELTATEHLTPLTMAQLHALPDGSEVVIEGRIDPQNATPLDHLAVYVREDHLAADLDEGYSEERLTRPIVIALPDGQVRLVNNDYALQNLTTVIKVPGLQGYSQLYAGLAIDEPVTVVGTVQRDAKGLALRARAVAGGTWSDYRRRAAAPIGLAALLLGVIVVIGLILWQARVQTQRQVHGTI